MQCLMDVSVAFGFRWIYCAVARRLHLLIGSRVGRIAQIDNISFRCDMLYHTASLSLISSSIFLIINLWLWIHRSEISEAGDDTRPLWALRQRVEHVSLDAKLGWRHWGDVRCWLPSWYVIEGVV